MIRDSSGNPLLDRPKIKDNAEGNKKDGRIRVSTDSAPVSAHPVDTRKRMYPEGLPLSLGGKVISQQQRPKSTSDGEYIWRDFSSRAGCAEKQDQFARGKRDLMATSGLRGSIRMQLSWRGGRRGGGTI